MASLRERNRNRAMREIQALAMDMFESNGFDTVTVEQIAAKAGVSPSTVYRYFGTKERIVIWDPSDQALEDDIARRLATTPPVEAFRDALMAAFADEKGNQPLLRRVRFLFANTQVHAAAIEQDLSDQEELAKGFAAVAGRARPSLEDRTRAGICMAALDAAIYEWQRDGNKVPLTDLIARAFEVI